MPTRATRDLSKMRMTGARIRTAREAAGFTQNEVAQAAGFANAKWLSEIENGRNSIDAHDLKKVADFLGYPVEWFLDDHYKGGAFTPKTRLDWQLMFPDSEERARAHADLDQIFLRVGPQH